MLGFSFLIRDTGGIRKILLPGVKAFARPKSQGPIFDGSMDRPSSTARPKPCWREKTFLLPVAAGSGQFLGGLSAATGTYRQWAAAVTGRYRQLPARTVRSSNWENALVIEIAQHSSTWVDMARDFSWSLLELCRAMSSWGTRAMSSCGLGTPICNWWPRPGRIFPRCARDGDRESIPTELAGTRCARKKCFRCR